MSVIIRLQNLPWSANALDIRQYFHGLAIPEGGVHIVGGELGDAFIAFSTDEDARQAFNRSNGKIKEVQITLMLSSRTEMQRVIEQARSQSYAAFMQSPVVPMPAAVPSLIPQTQEIRDKEREKNDKRDSRRKSRSKSRDRRDRSRDRRDRRHRNRSRSRSRDRRSSRRREKSRSRGRSRSKERKSREYRKRSEEPVLNPFQRDNSNSKKTDIWTKQKQIETAGPNPLTNFAVTIGLNQPNRQVDARQLDASLKFQGNGNSSSSHFLQNNWMPNNNGEDNYQNRNQNEQFQNRFQKNSLQSRSGFFDNNANSSISLEPFYGGYGDVRRFFHGMFISNNGIKFINDQNGRSTGVVFVRFSCKKFKEEALRMSGELLNGGAVTISHISDEEFEEATDRYNPRSNHDDHPDVLPYKSRNISKYFNTSSPASPEIKNFSCLIVDDLPTYCKEQDILHMFSQHPLVALILTNKKRGGFIAYVKFSSAEVAKQAYEETALHIVAGKQVTVKPCKDEDFDDINKKHDVNLNSSNNDDIGTECLNISGLPEKTTDKDISDLFSDIGVIPTKIHLISNNLGFTGEAYCEFANSDEATRATRKNKTSVGNECISVVPISREVMESILGNSSTAPEISAKDENSDSKEVIVENKFPPKPALLPLMSSLRGNFKPRGQFPSRQQFDVRGPRMGGHRFGNRLRFAPPKDIFDDVPPGCTVYMKNVPYKANTNEILNFFDGFSHSNNVSRRYNPNNTPSDEAKIIFFEAEEAARAVRELQKEKIWDRQIFLRQE